MAQLVALSEKHKLATDALDKRTALICTVIANSHRDPKKRALKISDFMPKIRKKSKPMSNNDMLKSLEKINTSLGGETYG